MTHTEYRVETRRTERHPAGEGRWVPESDHLTFLHITGAQTYLGTRVRWYANPDAFEHRIVSREVSDWAPVEEMELP